MIDTEAAEAISPSPAAVLSEGRAQIVEATDLAWSWHGHQTRKGRVVSYMTHLSQVHGLVIDAGGNVAAAIAALLHDGLEDAPDPAERAVREGIIQERFGREVLQIVLDCTDTTPAEAGDQKGPWRERKERYLTQLRTAGPASLLVAACDKRHNLGDLVNDLRWEGPATLDRFNAGAAEQVWYFETLIEICRPALPPHLAKALDDLIQTFRELTAH